MTDMICGECNPCTQAVQDVIVYAPDPALRRRAYIALTKANRSFDPVDLNLI
jgi:hypothetical protein